MTAHRGKRVFFCGVAVLMPSITRQLVKQARTGSREALGHGAGAVRKLTARALVQLGTHFPTVARELAPTDHPSGQ